MTLITEPGHPFDYYVRALRGQYNNNLQKLIEDCNKDIFLMRRKQTPWFMSVPHAKLQVGKFYLINYDFNGNKLYCPIFTIDYRVRESGKHVLYAINLDYLPFDYKVLYFNKLQDLTKQLFEFNADAPDFMREKAIPINFEQIYNTLKDNGDYNYAISAFDVTKLTEIFGVSTNLMYLMIHVHLRPVNVALMKTLMESYEKGTEEREKLEKIISDLDNVYETYEEDVQNYYKKLKSIEANYKLFEN
jgi:hypothetical protein